MNLTSLARVFAPPIPVVVPLLLAAMVPGCSTETSEGADDAYTASVLDWAAEREASLQSETGWLNLAGLYWLEEGASTFGADPGNDVVFPRGPGRIGTFTLRDGQVRVETEPGVSVRIDGEPASEAVLTSDVEDAPTTVMELGSLRWFAIERDGRVGIRLRDLDHPGLAAFEGVERFPIDPVWRVDAVLEAHEEPVLISIPTILGTVRRQESPGTLVFTVDPSTSSGEAGVEYRLDPVLENDGRWFLIFADGTTGVETYGGGRFVYVDPADEEGRTVIDFNRAYNPPCAFSAFSTCPQPPPQNRLSLRITAGEKVYRHPAAP